MSLPVPGSKCGEETVTGGWCRARVAPGSDPASSGAPRATVTLGPLRRPWCRLCQVPTTEVVCGAGGRPWTKPSVQVPSAPALLGLTVPSPIPRIPGGTRGGGAGGWTTRASPPAPLPRQGTRAALHASSERTLSLRTTFLVNRGEAGEAAVRLLRPTD